MFATAITTGLQAAAGFAGTSFVYTRGGTTLTVTAVLGRSVVEEINPNGLGVVTQVQDAILADYGAFRSTFSDPQPGDTLTAADGRVYRVLPAGPDDACWRWLGTDRNGLRIHCKLTTDA